MGIQRIVETKRVMVAQCGHCENAVALWTTNNDGSVPPDLIFSGFPKAGRMLLTNQVIYMACEQCKNGLADIFNKKVQQISS